MSYFSSPVSYQRGRGLDGLIRGVFRLIKPLFKKPLVKKGLKALGKAATAAALEAGQKALQAKDIHAFAPALKESGKQQAKDLLKRITGGKGKINHKRTVSHLPVLVKRRRVQSRSSQRKKKKKSRDIFVDQ